MFLVPTGLQDLWIGCDIRGPTEGPGSLLFGMGRLQHLTSLYVEFENILLDWPPSPAGPAFAGLAASSKLVSLIMYEPKFPRDVWPHVFPATHTLPHLTCLRASANEWGAPAVPGAWGAADVSSLVSCCPNLCEIEDWTLQHGSHVSELRKLTALTNMYVVWSVDSVSAFEESLKGLAALTQLEVLHVGLDSQELSVTSLLPLTSLTALKSLFRRDGISSSSPWELNLASTQVNLVACIAGSTEVGTQICASVFQPVYSGPASAPLAASGSLQARSLPCILDGH